MSAAPLLRGFAAGAPVGWRNGQPVAWERLVSSAAVLASALPRDGHCINLCEDRLNFILGFAAALMARATSLLPQSRAPGAIAELGRAYPGAVQITDRPDAPGRPSLTIGKWPGGAAEAVVPEIPLAHRAAILFTSGSTGEPRPHVKTWGSLVRASAAVQACLSLPVGSSLLGVVPAQHMWGFETTVMLPLQSGCAVAADCPLLPAEIAAALDVLPAPRWLVATPLHLRACVAAPERLAPLAGILCATSTLAPELAAAVERRHGAALHEIYGSTETGTLASRRPAETQAFKTLGSITLTCQGRSTIACGGHLPEPVALNDAMELQDATRFILRGRLDDLVKIAGKRGSLAALNAELARAPGVSDGVFWLREDGAIEPRLAAFVVAPRGSAADIIEHLRQRVDAVFLPRPLVLVESLPRNRAGKLTRESLSRLAAAHGLAPKPAGGEASRWQEVADTHPALPFHFPGDPLVPGVWLLALVEREARERFGAALAVCGVADARFRCVLRPTEPFRITLDRLGADRLAFSVESARARIADGTLAVRESP